METSCLRCSEEQNRFLWSGSIRRGEFLMKGWGLARDASTPAPSLERFTRYSSRLDHRVLKVAIILIILLDKEVDGGFECFWTDFVELVSPNLSFSVVIWFIKCSVSYSVNLILSQGALFDGCRGWEIFHMYEVLWLVVTRALDFMDWEFSPDQIRSLRLLMVCWNVLH